MSTDYDVIVVGGGPAGLTAARSAAAGGAEVLLLELQAQIGQTKTSVWLADGVMGDEFSKAKVDTVNKINLHSAHNSLESEGSFGSIWDRSILDKLLASKAASSGVEIWVGSPVKSLLVENGVVTGVKCEVGDWSEEIEGKIVIDASGSGGEWSSLFRREILDLSYEKNNVIQTNEYLMANPGDKKELDLYFNSFLAPGGYAWIHSFSDKFAMAGIRGKRIHPDSALDEFLGSEEPPRLKDSVPIGAYRGQLPGDYKIRKSVSDGILAVGSSAGQIYPLSGHGLRYAVESGRLAGRISAECVERGDFSESKLIEYDRKWKNKFGWEIKLGRKLYEALETSLDRKMDAAIEFMESRPRIKNYFVDIFLGANIENSVKGFFEKDEIPKIFGREISNEILSLCE